MKRKCYVLLSCALMLILVLSLATGCGKKNKKDDTPQNSGDVSNLNEETEMTEETEESEATEEASGKDPETFPEIYSDEPIKDYGSVVVLGDAAFELFTYRDDTGSSYASAVNRLAADLKGTADVYNVVIPLSSGITFPDNRRDEISSSDQRAAMESIFDMLSDDVKVVDIYNSLMVHRTEYIYFRTDHHWTQLGAYYAYEDFCEAKGIEAEDINSYATEDFPGFLGSFYNDTDGDSALGANPDTVSTYAPNCNSLMHVTATDGTEYDWPVINDVTAYGASIKYSTFIAADNPMTVITNSDLSDGSSCVVVKESFGNAFVPFLVDHYQTIYVIDYRYWNGSVASFVKEKGVDDVLVINNLSMIRNKKLVGDLQGVF